MGKFVKVLWPMVGLVSTLSGLTPNVFESIKTFNNLDGKNKITWEVLKVQLTLH
jgi:hypothetical protein